MAGVAALLLGCSSDDDDSEDATGSADSAPDRSGGDPATTPDDLADAAAPTGKILIVGAGPAGLSAAHLLTRAGVDVEVFEANSTHGGRIRHDLTFVDFPIPLGAEWVHVDADVLDEIVDDPEIDVETVLIPYDDAQLGWYDDGLKLIPMEEVTDDLKFVGSSWLDFFDTYIVPGIADRIRLDTPIVTIDHGGEVVRLTDASGIVHEGDRVIVTAPLKILQRRDIEFVPPLPDDRLETIDGATVWSGFKAFFEFSERFYPAALSRPGIDSEDGQRWFYDAAYGQNSDFNVFGVFSVGNWADYYQGLSDDQFRDEILAELDEIYDGAASANYVRHFTQNWNEEPFARAAYLEDDAPSSISRQLAPPIGDRLFFAGDAYTSFDDWSSVHTAARSAADTVDQLLGGTHTSVRNPTLDSVWNSC